VDTPRTDPTTGLEVLTDASVAALRRASTLACIDLVHFCDRVNAPFGHVGGDRVLAAVGRRLADGLVPWRVFQSAGDEFTVEVAGPLDREGAESLADGVAAALARPFEETGEGLEATVGPDSRARGRRWSPLPALDGGPRGSARGPAYLASPGRASRSWTVRALGHEACARTTIRG
jgi:hypothetical protein